MVNYKTEDMPSNSVSSSLAPNPNKVATSPPIVNPNITPKPSVAPMPQGNSTPQLNTMPQKQYTIDDFGREYTKLQSNLYNAQASKIKDDTSAIADQFLQQAYGRNVGGQSGIGQDMANRAMAEQNKRLEQTGAELSANLGLAMLDKKYNLALNDQQFRQSIDKQTYEDIKAGRIDPASATQFLQQYLGLDPNDPNSQNILKGFLGDYQAELNNIAMRYGGKYDPITNTYTVEDGRGGIHVVTATDLQQIDQAGGYDSWQRSSNRLVSANQNAINDIQTLGYGNIEAVADILYDPQYTTAEAREQAVREYITKNAYGGENNPLVLQAVAKLKESNGGVEPTADQIAEELDRAGHPKTATAYRNIQTQIEKILKTMVFDDTPTIGGGGTN